MRAAALAALVLAGCSGKPATQPVGQGPTIVSLNPCSDAILAQVARPEQLLAISHYSHDPRSTSMDLAAARRIPATGGTVEEVAALAPDIVVGSSFMAPATRAALERLGMRVETVGMAATVEESEAQVRELARIAGQPDRGEELVRRIEGSLAVPDGAPIDAALWQAGGIVPGRATLIAELMRRAGFASWSEAHGMAQADYLPLETIVADPPELLLISGREEGQSHPVLAHLPDTKIARFDPALTYCGGPSIPRAMERLQRLRTQVRAGGGAT